ncbi:hypothetical protein HY339_02115 [Candidatus Gottesmanbacteria bacterium]|nr:hypothetical protein [Candidatus Gottesmanbacteria bacterium]
MKITSAILLIAILYLLIFFGHAVYLKRTVYGDGVFYFSWVRSIIVDGDINFANEYAHFGVYAPGNKHPIGAPLFWLPWYAQAHAIIQGNGYDLPYQLLTGFISVLATLSGLTLLYRQLRKAFSQTASMLAILSIAGATNLFFYGAVDPVNSHAISFFAATVFLSFLFSKNVSPFLTGCALGFCALVRPQDAVLGLLAFPKYSKAFFLGLIVTFFPQLLAWQALYGALWTNPYLTMGESFSWWSPHFFDVLFSPTNGLFLWTPITLLATGGFLFWKDKRRVWFFALFALEVAIVGSWSIWWQGASYSGRMLVSTLPVLAFGLAALYTKLKNVGLQWKSMLLAIIGSLTFLNVLFIVRFLLRT